MQSSLKIKEILHIVESVDPQTFNEQFDQLQHLNQIVSEGNSTILTNKDKIFQSHPLVSLLTFGETFENGINYTSEIEENELRIFQSKTESKKADADDEVIEVKYVAKPNKWAEINNGMLAIVSTDSKKIAEFCELVELNYFYDTKGLNGDEVLGKFSDIKNLDLLILHHSNSSQMKSDELLKHLDKEVGISLSNANFVKVVFTTFAKNIDPNLIFNKQLKQLDQDEKKKELLKDIIPNQTWQYNRGELVHSSGEGFSFMLSITYKKNQNRPDSIMKLSDYSNVSNYTLFGGNIIVSSGFIREILFELGKLPEFGA